MIPDNVYSLLFCNMFLFLVLFLVVRPLYEAYMIRRIRVDVLKNVLALLESFRAEWSGICFLSGVEGDMNLHQRVVRLAKVLGMKPTERVRAIVSDGKWWIVGCDGDDRPIPRSGRYMSMQDAIERAEAWLAPELHDLAKKERAGGQSDDKRSD